MMKVSARLFTYTILVLTLCQCKRDSFPAPASTTPTRDDNAAMGNPDGARPVDSSPNALHRRILIAYGHLYNILAMVKTRVYWLYLCIWLLFISSRIAYAQNSTLEQCLFEQQKAMQVVQKNRPRNQATFPMLFDSTQQKFQQIFQDWGECVKGHHIPVSSFKTLNGESYDSSALAGKAVVVNFWFMSCVPCIDEMPALNKLVEEYKGKNVIFLGLSTDKAAVLKPAFFQQHPFNFKIITDAKAIAFSFHFLSYPTTYIVDQYGVIRKAWVGGNGLSKLDAYYRAKAAIDDLLAQADK